MPVITFDEKIFQKILDYITRFETEVPEDQRAEYAKARTRTWCEFLAKKVEMPLLILFGETGELHNLRIENVQVEYPTEPRITLEVDFKGEKRRSRLTYYEALKEVTYASRMDVNGVEKFRNIMDRLELEMIDTRKVRTVGNSLVVTIPESMSNLFGLKDGDYLSFVYRFGEVKVKKAESNV